MSQSHALSDDQVAGELKKMTAFIKQEALEKAREIQIKADEEFAIEKSKLVRQETSAIDSQYEKKFKQAAMSQQITRSTVANKTRLKILAARQELLDDLFEQAREKLKEFTKDKGRYQTTCKNLILEGLYAMNESKVQIRARKADFDLIRKSMDDGKKDYKEKTDKDVSLLLDEESPIPDGSLGGVTIVSGDGRIEINNTLDERLKILQSDALPAVRTTLFGPNAHRKFFD